MRKSLRLTFDSISHHNAYYNKFQNKDYGQALCFSNDSSDSNDR